MRRLHGEPFPECIGRRGVVLIVLAITDLFYGAAVIYARAQYRAPRTVSPDPAPAANSWWPVTQEYLFWIPTEVWGWVWVVAGLILLTGVCQRKDRWHFTLAVVIKVTWACAAGFRSAAGSGLWGVTALYIGFAAVAFVIAGWADEPSPPCADKRAA